MMGYTDMGLAGRIVAIKVIDATGLIPEFKGKRIFGEKLGVASKGRR